jgi:hypothetical protein
MSETTQRIPTYGEKACGVDFNPGGDALVATIKEEFAAIVTNLDELRTGDKNSEVNRMLSIAITEAQTAQMWAVKAITWKY